MSWSAFVAAAALMPNLMSDKKKVLLLRHARDFCIYRSLAIAQAFKAAGHEVSLECLAEHQRALSLTPEIPWKNPQAPHAVAEREWTDGQGKKHVRKGGALFDALVRLEGDAPFEHAWTDTGQPWWDWARDAAKTAARPLGDLPFIPAWPEITAKLPAANTSKPYVLVAVLSDEQLPSLINVAEIDKWVRTRFPDCAVVWSAASHEGAVPIISQGYTTLGFDSYLQLAAQIAEAEAVVAVNGMAGAIARSFVGGRPLAKRFWYVEGVAEERLKITPTRTQPVFQLAQGVQMGTTTGPGHTPKPDPFSPLRRGLAAPPSLAAGGILGMGFGSGGFFLKETQPGPD